LKTSVVILTYTPLIAPPEQPISGFARTYIDWGYRNASLLPLPSGSDPASPAPSTSSPRQFGPDLGNRRPSGHIIRQIHDRWPLISDAHPTGHYIALRERLETYSDQLAATIDKQ
jgi:hypothetical protein